MLTSSSAQYLHPDYLQPLPTTLDAKKSPLALLAQTCSSIGKDTTPAKSLIPPIERKDVPKDKESSSSSRPKSRADSPSRSKSEDSQEDRRKSQLSPSSKRDHLGSPEARDLSKSGSHGGSKGLHSLDGDASRSPGANSPSASSAKAAVDPRAECRSRGAGSVPLPPALSSSASQSSSSISLSYSNMQLEVSHLDSASKPLSASHHAALHAHKTEGSSASSSLHAPLGVHYPGYHLPLLGHPLPLDAASSAHLGLAAAGKLGAFPGVSSSALSPYVSYARVKTTTGANTLVPVCKDPYCTHCQAQVQSAQLGTPSVCSSGCTQCTHDKTVHVPTSLSAAHSAALGSLPLYPGALSATPGMSSLALSSLYPHAFGALPAAHHGLPYVCNWVNGSDYCGKRFTTSEELLQHLRTHTSATDTAAALSLAGLPYGGLGALPGLTPHLPTPGSLSPDSALRQAHYPRSLSPTSLLAASRFHPYKSALSSLTAPTSASGLPGASALPPPFYSPYALYGQRLGAAAVAP